MSIQYVFLERRGNNQWNFIDYSAGCVREFDWCDGSKLLERINEMHLEEWPSEHHLHNIGWRGLIDAEVLKFNDYHLDG